MSIRNGKNLSNCVASCHQMLDNFLNKTVVTDNIAEHQKLHITNTLGQDTKFTF